MFMFVVSITRNTIALRLHCPSARQALDLRQPTRPTPAYLHEIPSVIALETKATPTVQFHLTHNSGAIAYRLRGLIYWGEFHFVSCIIDRSGQVWFHDGITT